MAAFQNAEVATIQAGEGVTTDAALQSLLDIANREVPAVSVATGWGQRTTMWVIGSLTVVVLLLMNARANKTNRELTS